MAELVLTKEQQAVVENRGGTLLVSAAAGSGKTKVLVDRVLARVAEPSENCNVDDFLMITFTQAAAAELRGKLIAALSERLAQQPEHRHLQRQMSRVYLAQISTVHAFCSTLLREYAHVLELPSDFRVCDEQEAIRLRQRAMQNVLETAYSNLEPGSELAAALDMLGAGRDDRALAELIEKVYSAMQCFCAPDERLMECRSMLDVSAYTDVGQTIWGQYLLRELRGYLDDCLSSLQDARTLIETTEALQPYYPTILENIETVKQLAGAVSWEEIRTAAPDFGRLNAIRKCPEPEKQKKVQMLRKRVVDGLRRRLGKFALPSEELLQDLQLSGKALRGLLLLTERFSDAYRKEKLRRHALDYNDLEHETLRLLLTRQGQPTAEAREVSKRYTEIMVDEYQDTNDVQDAIFNAISRNGQNLFFVGDVKQSIYRFRLADPTIFLEKYKSFAPYTAAKPGQPRKILLSDNFRSHPEILDAANAVFRLTMTERVGGLRYGDAEALRPRRVMPEMGAPAVELHCIDMQSVPMQPPVERAEVEAEFVAERIAKLLDGTERIPEGEQLRPIRAEDIVILFRSLSGKAGIYMEALRRRGILSVCGNDDIFSSQEIVFLVALLQVIDNPHQDIPLLTVLLSPVFGFTADELAAVRAKNRRSDLFDALRSAERTRDFCETICRFRELAQQLPLCTLLDELDEKLMLRSIYGALPGGVQRGRNLDTFYAMAGSFESGDRHGLNYFLRYLDVVKERGVSSEDTAVTGAVRLLTVHKSKGLEFPVVFLADLCKSFNHTDARASVLVDTELGIGCSVYDMARRIVYPTIARSAIADRLEKENISEEMRVLYVAMTRAKYRMIMTCCTRRLVSKLTSIARDLTIPAGNAMIEGADCLGDWILMTAMTRTEAGALFALSNRPDVTRVSEHPWRILSHDALDYLPQKTQQQMLEQQDKQPLPPLQKRSYPYTAATEAPTKLTATQLKGRELDEEVSEHTAEKKPQLRFVRPRFVTGLRPLTPAERGTAIHLAMQYLDFAACTDPEGIRRELLRLEQQRFLTRQQLDAVEPEKLWRFFAGPLGQRVLHAQQVIREFKFSVLEDGSLYDPALQGEEILLQGVTDCCLIERGGLTILDFKSDHLRQGEEPERAEYYRGQLDAYSRALSRIFSRPVNERVIYFFSTDTAVFL